MADALVLESTNPFFALLIGRLFLRRRLSRLEVVLCVVAFGGVCLMLIHHNARGLLNPYALLALMAGVGRAVGSSATGVAGRTEPPERIMFYYALRHAVVEWRCIAGGVEARPKACTGGSSCPSPSSSSHKTSSTPSPIA